jgi:hypothetical protein
MNDVLTNPHIRNKIDAGPQTVNHKYDAEELWSQEACQGNVGYKAERLHDYAPTVQPTSFAKARREIFMAETAFTSE